MVNPEEPATSQLGFLLRRTVRLGALWFRLR